VEEGKKYNPREKIKLAQEWLDELKEEKRSQKNLLIRSSKHLSGSLTIDGSKFNELEKLYCFENKLTSLKLNGLKNLTEIQI